MTKVSCWCQCLPLPSQWLIHCGHTHRQTCTHTSQQQQQQQQQQHCHLVMRAIKQLEVGSLRARCTLHSAELEFILCTLQVANVQQQVLYPQTRSLTNGRQLRRSTTHAHTHAHTHTHAHMMQVYHTKFVIYQMFFNQSVFMYFCMWCH